MIFGQNNRFGGGKKREKHAEINVPPYTGNQYQKRTPYVYINAYRCFKCLWVLLCLYPCYSI